MWALVQEKSTVEAVVVGVCGAVICSQRLGKRLAKLLHPVLHEYAELHVTSEIESMRLEQDDDEDEELVEYELMDMSSSSSTLSLSLTRNIGGSQNPTLLFLGGVLGCSKHGLLASHCLAAK